MKKIFYGIGAIASISAPVVAVVSCSNKETGKEFSKVYKNEIPEYNVATPGGIDSSLVETWAQYRKGTDQFANPFPNGYTLEYKIKFALYKNDDNINDAFFVLKPTSLEILNFETYISTLEQKAMQADVWTGMAMKYDYLKEVDRHKYIRALLSGSKSSFASNFQQFFEYTIKNNETHGTRVEWSKATGDSIDKFIEPIVNNYITSHPLVR